MSPAIHQFADLPKLGEVLWAQSAYILPKSYFTEQSLKMVDQALGTSARLPEVEGIQPQDSTEIILDNPPTSHWGINE